MQVRALLLLPSPPNYMAYFLTLGRQTVDLLQVGCEIQSRVAVERLKKEVLVNSSPHVCTEVWLIGGTKAVDKFDR